MPDSPPSNAVHTMLPVSDRVMHISEIQNRIFSFNEVEDAARCAVVCKAWTEVALNLVWHRLDGLRPLFNLLAPLTPNRSGTRNSFDFTRKIRPADRIRFFSYAPRIKCFTIEAETGFPCESALNELLKSRLETSLLPNLKVFVVDTGSKIPLQLAVPFLHDRLENLQVDGFVASSSDVEIFFEEIALRSPKLQTLEFDIGVHNVERITKSLSQLLVNQASLEVIFLSPGMLTSSVLESLSCLPKLEQISVTRKDIEYTDLSASKSISCGQDNGGNRFQALRFLDLQTRLTSAASLISAHSSFASLCNLSIDMIFHNDAEDLQECLEIISQTCALLKLLEFSRNADNGNRRAVLVEEMNPITKETLAPLKSFPHLRHFSLTHTQRIVISDDDLIDLLSCCAPLSGLSLNSNPIQALPSTNGLPTLGSLHRIAQCQPELEHLSLYLNASIVDDSEPLFDSSVHSNPFPHLETLDLGKSDIRDVDLNGVTLYLCQVLPLECELEYEKDGDMSARKWKEVTERLPSLQKLCEEQRRRIHELESTVGTLRHQLKEANVDAAVQGIASVMKSDGQKEI